ncbi:MAG: hypothetical protein LBL00_00380 [Endomicrobium sp.]|jgi:hypothetical protein|nr:hypothetical protein [Endomicrobium sp.]
MKKLFYSLLVLSVCFAVSNAEYFYLKSGKVVNGKIISEADNSVTVSVAGTGTKRKIMLDEIDEITKNPKPLPAVTAKTESSSNVEKAKTQFSSNLKQDSSEGETYVKDNKSGVLVYNVQEAAGDNPKSSSAQPPASSDDEFDAALFLLGGGGSSSKADTPKTTSPKPKTTQKSVEEKPAPAAVQAKDDDFDAALFLLGGGGSSSKADTPKTTSPKKSKTTQKSVEEKPAPVVAQAEDDDFDAALFLLGGSSAKADTPAPAPVEEKKEVKAKKPKPAQQDDDYYDAALFLLEGQGQSAAKSEPVNTYKYVEPAKEKRVSLSIKPENETFLALAFDLKGVNIFSGTVEKSSSKSSADLTENTDYGISLSAEQYGYVSRFAAVGLGIGFQFKRGLEESPGRFSFLPLYAAFKMRFLSEEDYHFYAVAHLGYNFLIANFKYTDQSEAKGGLYYAGGIGASYNRYVFQILYSVNNASLKYSNSYAGDSVDKDIIYSKVGFYIGYIL